ncbi:MAG: HAD-IC family P-type ATPase, partial [Acidobacteriota bacterium]
ALSRVKAVAFDKTGTLTEGSPVVVQVRSEHCGEADSENCENCDDLLALVSAVERRSEHPLARAMVSESIARGVAGKYPDAVNVTALQGQGVRGQVNGRSIQIGSHRLFDSLIPHREDHCSQAGKAAELGYTPVMVSAEGHYLGFLSLADTVRQTSREALQGLRSMGLQALVMLTGDSAGTAQRVAQEVGVTDVRAELMPESKVVAVEDLKRLHGTVAMVGDGINDTPALSSATVGIALGGSAGGTDQALEASDITLLGGDLRRLPFALRLSRSAMRTIKANVAISLGLKLAFLVLVVMGLGTMWMAVLADVGTSLLVTLNGMHLLRWPRPEWDMDPV